MIFPFILIALSTLTHFSFFGWPRQVVFDEVYFSTFVGHYSTNTYYFDIHPPLAKLLTHFFGNLVGSSYDMDMTVIGNSLPWGVVLLRILPLVAGLLLPLIIYYICRSLNFSKLSSFAAGLLIIFENSLLVQSRFLLFDSIMILCGFGAILSYLFYVRKGGNGFLVISAFLCAGAFSIKWTGLAFPLLLLIAELVRTQKIKNCLKFLSLYALIGLFVYLSVFAIHFSYLTRSGPGDVFMTDRFQKTLDGNSFVHNPDLQPKGFFGKFFELNYKMYDANKTLTADHDYGSPSWSWPLLIRPVFYWQGTGDIENNSYIYLLGNPFIYWLSTISIIFLAWHIVFRKLRDKIALFIVTGFLVNFVPYMFIGRVMFLYHYEAALVFAILAMIYIAEKYIPVHRKKLIICITLALCLASFVYFSPLTYGLSLSKSELMSRMWLPTWR